MENSLWPGSIYTHTKMANKKGNMVMVLMVIVLVLALFLALTRQTTPKVLHKDATRQAVTESDITVRKSVFDGIGRAMREGLGTNSKVWFCNKPLPPRFTEANISLRKHTNELLEEYFEELRAGGYYEDFDDLTYEVKLPMEATAEKKIPGYSVIITDLSGSMSFLMGGRRKDDIVQEMNSILVDTVLQKTPGAKLGLVTYSYGSDLVQPLTEERDELNYAISRMRAPNEGATCIACGIYQAVKELVPPPPPATKPTERPLSVVLMTDGGANECHETSAIIPECLLLDYPASPGCDRETARAQAVEYARQARERYGIELYGVIFATDYCPPGVVETDCYDPDTMCNIVKAGSNCTDCSTCTNYAEGRNEEELEEIYREYGSAVAKYVFRNLTYMKLENDIVRANAPRVTSGLDRTDLKTQQDITGEYTWGFKTWWLYKNMMNWLLFDSEIILERSSLKSIITGYKPCKAVFYNDSNNPCPPAGSRHMNQDDLAGMSLSRADLRPVDLLTEIEHSFDKRLNGTNITCNARFTSINISNIPVFDYRPGPPVNIPVNSPYGNGTLKQTGDGVNSLADCPHEGPPPEGREALSYSTPIGIGKVGPNKAVNSQCSAGREYEYVGMDRTVHLDIVVLCEDTSIGEIMDGVHSFEPLSLEFILRVDVMNDCDPPDDVAYEDLVC
jgi:hypothetical protein